MGDTAYDTVVDTTYVEDCKDVVTQECHQVTQQVHHSSAVVGHASHVHASGYGRGGYHKREADAHAAPKCHATTQRHCQKRPVQNARKVPKQVCHSVPRKVCVPVEVKVPRQVCHQSHVSVQRHGGYGGYHH